MKNNKIAILVDSGTDVPEELIKIRDVYDPIENYL